MADDTDKAAPAALTTAAAGGALTGVKPAAENGNSALFKTDELTPAKEMAASGALIETTIVERVPTDHPAIDNNPRAGQSVAANRIDMNDPTVPGHVQTARNLGLADDYDKPKA